MAATAATTKSMTVEDLERDGTPEGRWELIDGVLVEMSPSSSVSSRIGMRFGNEISNHVRPRKLGDVFGADGGFVVFPGRQMVRVADAAFVATDRLPPPDEWGFYRLAPDLVVEVISPTDRKTEVRAKVKMWLDAGVRLVWVADPKIRSITVYLPDGSSRLLTEGDDLTDDDVLPEFRVPVASFFV